MTKTLARSLPFLAGGFFCANALAALSVPLAVKSPDGQNEIRLYATPLSYEILRDGITVVGKTPIDLTIDGLALSTKSAALRGTRGTLAGREATPVYKKSEIDLSANTLFADGGDWGVRLLARNDGVAYRFESKRPGTIRVNGETAPLTIPDRAATCFVYRTNMFGQEEAPADKFKAGELVTDPRGPKNWLGKGMVYLPLAYSVRGKCVAVTESDVHDYPIWNLTRPADAAAKDTGSDVHLDSRFAGWPRATERWRSWDGSGPRATSGGRKIVVSEHADFLTETEGTRTFPWRAFVLADSFSKFCEADLVRALATPADVRSDFSWVRPGKVAWDWWNAFDNQGEGDAGCNTRTYERFIDFAAKNGIEYVIFDEGWSEELNIWKFRAGVDVPHLIAYARERNVGIILWMAWAQIAGDEEHVAEHFAKLGARGFKVDFMDRGDAGILRFLEKFAAACARHRMMVDYHGVCRPVGLERTYPNIINYEGVHGLEMMKGFVDSTEKQVMSNDVCAFFVRLIAGPMDYTPGAMLNFPLGGVYHGSAKFPGSVGTRCHQLAQFVLYEAPLQMLCDSPTNYERNEECLKFLARIPTTWRRTVGLGGAPDAYAACARQAKDGSWYAAALSTDEPHAVALDTSFLDAGEWTAEIFRDADDADRRPTHFLRELRKVKPGETLSFRLAPGGGCALHLVKDSRIARDFTILSRDFFEGGLRTVFDFHGHRAWIVEPADGVPVAEGRPWTWTMQWAEAFVNRTPVRKLLARGWHHATIDTFRHRMDAEGLAISRKFQDYLVNELGLAPKTCLIGMSWGGFFSTRYAVRNPGCVQAIYYDAPLMNFAAFGDGRGDGPWTKDVPADGWANSPEMPVNMAAALARADIPLLLLYGGADTVVPCRENCELFATRYRAAGGTNLTVVKRAAFGHHPHGVDESDRSVANFFLSRQEAGR